MLIELTPDEVELLCSALDSYEYWEHRDVLPHDSGYITIMDDDDFAANVLAQSFEDDREELQQAWDAVKDARALDVKLRGAT